MYLQMPEDLPEEQIEVWQQASEYFHRAYQRQRRGDWAGAIQDYKHSLNFYPTAEAHTFLGWVYAHINLYEEAMAECRRAIELDPDFGNPYNDIGAYLMEQQRLREAIPWFERAMVSPRYETRVFPYFNLGRVYERLYDWSAALALYRAATDIDPNYRPARIAYHRLQARIN